MARPKKNNADYFAHDADMRNDSKLKAIRRKYGIVGYGVYVMLIEHLTNCDFFEYEDTTLNIELLAGDFDIEPDKLNEILDYFKMLKLITRKDGKILSEKLKERFESLLNKRVRQAEEKEKQKTKTKNKTVIANENPQSKVKESKVNKTTNVVVRDDIDLILVKGYVNQIKEHKSQWSEALYMQHDLKNGTLGKLLDDFVIHLQTQEIQPPSLSEFKKHFVNWLNVLSRNGKLGQHSKRKQVGAL